MRIILIIAALACVAANAMSHENIALGAPYTLDPAPNYAHCTDPGDATQLTDGKYSEGYFWTQPGTVGWGGVKPVTITLDLGHVRPIRGLSFNTAAGAAGVCWPEAIYVLVADEDKQYHEVGELVTLDMRQGTPPDTYAVHRFQTDTLRTHGRYVTLVVEGTPYTFVDEIEVYAGEEDWRNTPLEGPGIADVKTYMQELKVRRAVLRRMQKDTAVMLQKVEKATLPQTVRDGLQQRLKAALEGSQALPNDYGNDFRNILPLNGSHAEVFQVQAALWRALDCGPLTAWSCGAWDPLSPFTDPPKEAQASLDLRMMSNEYRAGAFNLSNAEENDRPLSLQIKGLPGGDNPSWITVHEVLWTDTSSGQPVAAALPEASTKDAAFCITVPSGLTRQVWLTLHPVDVPPGTYDGVIQVNGAPSILEVPLKVRVEPLRFPEHPRLHCGGWDYTDLEKMYQVTPENHATLIRHLREHYVDSPWATSAVLPFGTFDASGNLATPPDTLPMSRWQQYWPGAAQYCVFAAVGNKLGSFALGTPEFDAAVRAWTAFWAEYMRKAGLKPEQLSVLLVDEPYAQEQDAIIIAWAKAMRSAQTGIRVWEDPVYKNMGDSNPEMARSCDVLCPNRQIFLGADQPYRDFFAEQRERGATLEFYACSGPARLLDPYRYYRLQAWDCWRYGATASYFWAFGDGGGASSWNEYLLPRSAYTPLFLDNTTVTPGKQMEACREGIEDYEYLAMLQDAINEAAAKGTAKERIDEAHRLLTEVMETVSSKDNVIMWHSGSVDRAAADTARFRILDCLTGLKP